MGHATGLHIRLRALRGLVKRGHHHTENFPTESALKPPEVRVLIDELLEANVHEEPILGEDLGFRVSGFGFRVGICRKIVMAE